LLAGRTDAQLPASPTHGPRVATDDEIREDISGNLCRCTGYEHMVKAIRAVKARAAS